jgi:hypothetical protein
MAQDADGTEPVLDRDLSLAFPHRVTGAEHSSRGRRAAGELASRPISRQPYRRMLQEASTWAGAICRVRFKRWVFFPLLALMLPEAWRARCQEPRAS